MPGPDQNPPRILGWKKAPLIDTILAGTGIITPFLRVDGSQANGRFRPLILLTGLVLLALLAGVRSSAFAWVFYQDDRRPSEVTMVGTLEVDLPHGTGLGTAVLVDKCGILTNFHVVFGPREVTALQPPSPAFTGTFTLTEVWLPDGTHPTARATPVIWGDYRGPDRHCGDPRKIGLT